MRFSRLLGPSTSAVTFLWLREDLLCLSKAGTVRVHAVSALQLSRGVAVGPVLTCQSAWRIAFDVKENCSIVDGTTFSRRKLGLIAVDAGNPVDAVFCAMN